MKNKLIILIGLVLLISFTAVTAVSADPIMRYKNQNYAGTCYLKNCDNECPQMNSTLGNVCPNVENCTYNCDQEYLRLQNRTMLTDCPNVGSCIGYCDQTNYNLGKNRQFRNTIR